MAQYSVIIMDVTTLGVSSLRSSRLAYGCWRVAGTWDPAQVTRDSRAAGAAAIRCAFESGYTLFDTADIYCNGESEVLLGKSLKEIPGMREQVVIATKCGIRFPGTPHADAPQRYDFSAEHIMASCEGSLKRLGLQSIDLYMLHRPDYLADPHEIADAFTKLKEQGKVRYFGVSNFRPTLVTALQVVCPMPLVVHQVEISLLRMDPFTDGTLDQCMIERITPMAWSPLGGGVIGNGASDLLPSQQGYSAERVSPVLDEIAASHGVTRSAIALAWLLKHPSGIMPVVGSIKPERIREAVRATEVQLSREEWYKLLLAARGEPLP
jgi:predicted oxidoreductase